MSEHARSADAQERIAALEAQMMAIRRMGGMKEEVVKEEMRVNMFPRHRLTQRNATKPKRNVASRNTWRPTLGIGKWISGISVEQYFQMRVAIIHASDIEALGDYPSGHQSHVHSRVPTKAQTAAILHTPPRLISAKKETPPDYFALHAAKPFSALPAA